MINEEVKKVQDSIEEVLNTLDDLLQAHESLKIHYVSIYREDGGLRCQIQVVTKDD